MSNITIQDFKAQMMREDRKKSKSSWWKFGFSKAKKDESLNRRFQGDERPYSEQHKGKRRVANFLSYIFQGSSVATGAYLIYALCFEVSWIGVALTCFGLLFLWVVEWVTRFTSDSFWDEFALGRFDIKFAMLNFAVIWTINAAISLGGVYYVSNDTAAGPGGSAITNDPAYIGMLSRLKDAKAGVADAKASVKAYSRDPNNTVMDGGKRVLKYKLTKTKDKMDLAVLTAKESVVSINKQMEARFGVVNVADEDAMNYWVQKKNARVWFAVGLQFLFMLCFEISMWYRSKYDCELWWERLYEARIGKKPKSATKKNSRLKKPNPRPLHQQGGVTDRNTTSFGRNSYEQDRNVTDFDVIEKVLDVTIPPPLPAGVKYCKHTSCTETVTGGKSYCCTAHKQAAYRERNGRA